MGEKVLWYGLITLGFVEGLTFLYFAFSKSTDGDREFRLVHLVSGRRSMAQKPRRQLLIEGVFLLALAAGVLGYRLSHPNLQSGRSDCPPDCKK